MTVAKRPSGRARLAGQVAYAVPAQPRASAAQDACAVATGIALTTTVSNPCPTLAQRSFPQNLSSMCRPALLQSQALLDRVAVLCIRKLGQDLATPAHPPQTRDRERSVSERQLARRRNMQVRRTQLTWSKFSGSESHGWQMTVASMIESPYLTVAIRPSA